MIPKEHPQPQLAALAGIIETLTEHASRRDRGAAFIPPVVAPTNSPDTFGSTEIAMITQGTLPMGREA